MREWTIHPHPDPLPGRERGLGSAGFTLLEVLVAMAILGLALTTLLQLSSQALRLLRLSGEHQEAVLLADRLAREAEATSEEVTSGTDGPFDWERRIDTVPVADELTSPLATARPRLFSVSVVVRWGRSRSLEVATLRTVVGDPLPGVPGGPTPTAPGTRSQGLTRG